MFQWEIIESLIMIGVISAAFVWYGVWEGRREDRNTESADPIGVKSPRHKKIA